MKTFLFIIGIVFSFRSVYSQSGCKNPDETVRIENESKSDIEIMIWKDSRLIHHHIMKPEDELKILSDSDLLVNYKYMVPCHANKWRSRLLPYSEFKRIWVRGYCIINVKCPQV